jgi:hypothetical protein
LVSTLSGPDDTSTSQSGVKALAQIVNSPGGAIWYLNESENIFQPVALQDADDRLPSIPVDSNLVNFIKREGWLIDLNEYKSSP